MKSNQFDPYMQYFTIYCIKDPVLNEVKYVGSTALFEERCKRHLTFDENAPDKSKWIADLLKKGLKPVFEELERCPYYFKYAREAHYIVKFNNEGHTLLNKKSTHPMMTARLCLEVRYDLRGLLMKEAKERKINEMQVLEEILVRHFDVDIKPIDFQIWSDFKFKKHV